MIATRRKMGNKFLHLRPEIEIPQENPRRKWKTSFITPVVATEGAAFARQNVISASQYLLQVNRLSQLRDLARLPPIHPSPRSGGLGENTLVHLRLLSR